MVDDDDWCAIPGALVSERGVILLREPAGTDMHDLVMRLDGRTYSKPFVVDDGETRRLHFSLDSLQSEMRLDDPCALTFRYTQKMMACLLFLPKPRHVGIVGLGGGSLTKFCYRQLPHTRITTIEVNQDVIRLGALFNVPRQDARLRILHADACDYFAAEAADSESMDVILLDGCDEHGTAPAFCSVLFYKRLRERLCPDGVLVVNVTGSAPRANANLRRVADAFDGRVIVIGVRTCGNRLAFAFNDSMHLPSWRTIIRRADSLTEQHKLDFHRFARLLRHAHRKLGSRTGWGRGWVDTKIGGRATCIR